MVYWFIAISLGTFLLGYALGLDKGLRNAHRDITLNQLKKSKAVINRSRSNQSVEVYDPMWSSKPRLRLIKKEEDTRE